MHEILATKIAGFIKRNNLFFILFPIFFAVGLVWFSAFYPAFMSTDSVYMWSQTKTLHFDAATAYIYTLIILILRTIWDSPAIISLLQIATSSFIYAYFLNFFAKNNIKKLHIYFAALLYVVIPYIHVYNITVWKDVYFAQGILLLALLWIKESSKEGRFLVNTNIGLAIIALITVIVSLFRLNGILLLLIVPLMFALTIPYKKIFKLIAFGVVFYLCLGVWLPNYINLDRTRMKYFGEANKIQLLASIIKMGGEITSEEAAVISKIMPIEEFKNRYRCTGIDPLYINNSPFNETVLYDDAYRMQFEEVFYSVARKNFPYIVADRACLLTYTLDLGSPRYTYLHQPNIDTNKIGLQQEFDAWINTEMQRYLDWSKSLPQRGFFWMNLLYVSIYLVLFVVSVLKKQYSMLIFTLYFLINLGIISLLGVSMDFRYLYMFAYSWILLPSVYYASRSVEFEQSNINLFRKTYKTIEAFLRKSLALK